MAIKSTLRQELVTFLTPFHFFDNINSRKALLLQAGLDPMLGSIDLSGSPAEFVNLLLDQLDRYGNIADDTPALVQLLESVATQVGTDKRQILHRFCAQIRQQPQTSHAPGELSQSSAPAQTPGSVTYNITTQGDYFEHVDGQAQVFTGPVNINQNQMQQPFIQKDQPISPSPQRQLTNQEKIEPLKNGKRTLRIVSQDCKAWIDAERWMSAHQETLMQTAINIIIASKNYSPDQQHKMENSLQRHFEWMLYCLKYGQDDIVIGEFLKEHIPLLDTYNDYREVFECIQTQIEDSHQKPSPEAVQILGAFLEYLINYYGTI